MYIEYRSRSHEEEIKRIVYHEAGHYVIANKLGLHAQKINLLYLTNSEGYNGQTEILTEYNPNSFFDGNYDDNAVNYSKQRIIELMAGTVAAALIRNDNESFENMSMEFNIEPPNGDDREKVYQFGYVLDQKEGYFDFNQWLQNTVEHVRENLNEIRQIGEVLLEKMNRTPQQDISYP